MSEDRQRGFFHMIDALTHQKQAVEQLDVGLSWAYSVEVSDIKKEMKALLKRLATEIGRFEEKK